MENKSIFLILCNASSSWVNIFPDGQISPCSKLSSKITDNVLAQKEIEEKYFTYKLFDCKEPVCDIDCDKTLCSKGKVKVFSDGSYEILEFHKGLDRETLENFERKVKEFLAIKINKFFSEMDEEKIFREIKKIENNNTLKTIGFSDKKKDEKNAQRKPFVELWLLDRCNYDCSYCIQFLPRNPNNYIKNISLFLEKFKKNFEPGCILNITGGEPFIHPEFLDIIRALVAFGYKIKITSNLSVTEHVVKEFLDICGNSLIGFTASLHLEFAILGQFLNKSILINEVIKSSPDSFFNVTSVAVPEFFPLYESFKKLFQNYEIDYGIQAIIPTEKYSVKEPKLYQSKIKQIFEEKTLKIDNQIHTNIEDASRHGENRFLGKTCYAGIDYFVVYYNGDVFRCFDATTSGEHRSGGKVIFSGSVPTSIEADDQIYLGNLYEETFKKFFSPKVCIFSRCVCPNPYWANMIQV